MCFADEGSLSEVTWDRVIREEKAEGAAKEEIAARKFKVDPTPYRLMSDAFGRIKRGLPLEALDFGIWLILGGMYVVNGKMSAEDLAMAISEGEIAKMIELVDLKQNRLQAKALGGSGGQ